MNRPYIISAISAMLEDIFGHKMDVPMRAELDSFFEDDEFELFSNMVCQEFDLSDNTIVDTAFSFSELVALLDDELSF